MGFSGRGSQDLSNATNVASELANDLSVFTSLVHALNGPIFSSRFLIHFIHLGTDHRREGSGSAGLPADPVLQVGQSDNVDRRVPGVLRRPAGRSSRRQGRHGRVCQDQGGSPGQLGPEPREGRHPGVQGRRERRARLRTAHGALKHCFHLQLWS